ncbi:MAG TPA: NAD(P)H-dependent oxidoreductase [Ohtaekwangia sp.]|uniref:NADPH-dependent FMN reductase n=1 Tax=Ohtaekwangia sp. TaxID=2066019 RepID=UPI002F9230D1
MSVKPKRIFAISGSLRAQSSTQYIIQVFRKFVPDAYEFIVYDGLASLPHFNDAEAPDTSVLSLRKLLAEADGVLICTPEYAFGVPGSLKNALDWTVSSGELVNKPTALITAATSGEHAHASLLLTLSALSATIADEARLLIPYVRAKLDKQGLVKDTDTLQAIESVCKALINSMQNL